MHHEIVFFQTASGAPFGKKRFRDACFFQNDFVRLILRVFSGPT